MHPVKRNVLAARLALETARATARAEIKRAALVEPAADASDEAWGAYYDAEEAILAAAGTYAAERALFDAERELLAWGERAIPSVASTIRDAARLVEFRERVVELLLRGPDHAAA